MALKMDNRELDRRVALEVMGEPEPPAPTHADLEMWQGGFRCWGTWHDPYTVGAAPRWVPADFSGDMDLAMRAVDKVLGGFIPERWLELVYFPVNCEWTALITDDTRYQWTFQRGDTAPEAICRCLLAFVERDEKEGWRN